MRRIMLLVLTVSVAFALVLGYELLSAFPLQAQPAVAGAAGAECSPTPTPQMCPVCHGDIGAGEGSADSVKRIDLRLPAVDKNKVGSLANLSAEAWPGSGRVYVRMESDNPLMNPETQNSLRTAIDVARKLVSDGFADKNLFYSITAYSDVVGGKSAGAAMTVATIALARGEEIRPDVVITGTVEANGSIGQVGEILAKAIAVKEAGYSFFLVPVGEGSAKKQVEKCEKKQETVEGGAVIQQVCTTTTETVNVSSEAGIQVIEVADVAQAYALMKK